jgi:predicted nucleic acid-binding protein
MRSCGVNRYVLDAWAWLAWLQDEPRAAEQVEALLEAGERNDCELLASIINVGEVYYTLAKRVGEDRAMEFRNLILRMPVKIIPAADEEVWQAVNFKKRFPISYADAFAASAAFTYGAALATGDPDFQLMGQSGPPLFWLGAAMTESDSQT